ncbi:MAG: hypothetical protein KGO49_10440 [Gammaproteobacteria bacterium]|nr:hypothetical protein [Gammaproteobacteria bacterium]
MTQIKARKSFWIATVVAIIVTGGLVWLSFATYYGDTPYKEGTGEYVGYTSARANGLKSPAECTNDPETVKLKGFVAGCKRWFELP